MPNPIQARFVGVELYFDDLPAAKRFYSETLGLKITDEDPNRYSKFADETGFICLEKKGSESYPSKEKAVLFFEVPDLAQALAAFGPKCIVESASHWAVLQDPEGHSILLLEQRQT